MTIIIWVTVIAAIITLAVGRHATDRWHIDRAAEEEAAKHPSQLQRNAHRTYPIRPFTAFTTCPGCGTVGCFPWELPPDPTRTRTPRTKPQKRSTTSPAKRSAHTTTSGTYGAEKPSTPPAPTMSRPPMRPRATSSEPAPPAVLDGASDDRLKTLDQPPTPHVICSRYA